MLFFVIIYLLIGITNPLISFPGGLVDLIILGVITKFFREHIILKLVLAILIILEILARMHFHVLTQMESIFLIRYYLIYYLFLVTCVLFKKTEKMTYLVIIGLALCAPINLAYYLLGKNYVYEHGSGFIAIRQFFGYEIERMGTVWGISAGGQSLIYLYVVFWLVKFVSTKHIHQRVPIYFLLVANVSAIIYSVSFSWVIQLTFFTLILSNIRMKILFTPIVLMLGYIFMNMEIIPNLTIANYIYASWLPKLENIFVYVIFGGGYDFPTSLFEGRGVRDVGIFTFIYSRGVIGIVYLLIPFILVLSQSNRFGSRLWVSTAAAFLHGTYYFYPILSFLSVLKRK